MKNKMGKILAAAMLGTALFVTGVAAAPEGEISVISREEGSGTRGAFVELFGIEEKVDGQKVDMTTLEAGITNSTSVMMTTVAGDENAIGYVSLGSLNDTVKAVKIDGAEPSVENVANETYKVSRPFHIVTGEELTEAGKDFTEYLMSEEGQQIVEDSGYIKAEEEAPSYQPAEVSGKVVVAGSSSVSPVMEKLKEAYEKINQDVTIEIQTSDSTTGIQSVKEGICQIGMASRELKEEEKEYGLSVQVLAKDGIAVIVNKENDIEELTSEQVKDIFTGEVTEW